MNSNTIKNLGVAVLGTLIIGYSAIRNTTPLGLGAAVAAVILLYAAALTWRKDELVFQKIDLYVFLTFLGILGIQYKQLEQSFTGQIFAYGVNFTLLFLAAAIGLGLAFSRVACRSKEAKNNGLGIILILGLVVIFAISLYFDYKVFLQDLPMLSAVFAFAALGSIYRSSKPATVKGIGAIFSHSFSLLAICLLILAVFFPAFSLSSFNTTYFLSVTILPWYVVIGVSLLLAAVTGLAVSSVSETVYDEDSYLFYALIGLLWTIKASLYFAFDFSYVLVLIYAFISFYLLRQVIAGKEIRPFLFPVLGLGLVILAFFINRGDLFFALCLVIGPLFVRAFYRRKSGWKNDFLFWESILVVVALAGVSYSLQSGYDMSKIILIAGLFAMASLDFYMMNHHNGVGQNKFKITKIVMVSLFGFLVFFAAIKNDASVSIAFEKGAVLSGAQVQKATNLQISTGSQVKQLSYVWANSYLYNPADVKETNNTSLTLTSIKTNHLIVWATQADGVVTRKDRWFYSGMSTDSQFVANLPFANDSTVLSVASSVAQGNNVSYAQVYSLTNPSLTQLAAADFLKLVNQERAKNNQSPVVLSQNISYTSLAAQRAVESLSVMEAEAFKKPLPASYNKLTANAAAAKIDVRDYFPNGSLIDLKPASWSMVLDLGSNASLTNLETTAQSIASDEFQKLIVKQRPAGKAPAGGNYQSIIWGNNTYMSIGLYATTYQAPYNNIYSFAVLMTSN